MQDYIRKVAYHETDKMGITHHSNYIKWMEEARVYFLDQIGFGYAKLESEGIASPVIGVECQYKNPTTFDDEVLVHVEVCEYRGVKLVVKYEMTDLKTGKSVLEGKTTHCFIDDTGKPIVLKKKCPLLDCKFKELLGK